MIDDNENLEFTEPQPYHTGANYTTSLSSEGAYRYAKEHVLEIVRAADDELQIDLDTEEDYEYFLTQMVIFKRYSDVLKVVATPSSHGLPHRHIVITLPGPMPVLERIMWQACLGSDRVREMLTAFRVVCTGEKDPVFLFEKRE